MGRSRSASSHTDIARRCSVPTRIDAAGLSREALELLREHPSVGARLMTAVAKRLADRLRAAGDQLRIYAQLAGDMQQEIDRLRQAR